MSKKILEEEALNRWKKLAGLNEITNFKRRELDAEADDDNPEVWKRSWGARQEIIKTTVDAFLEKEKPLLLDPKKAFKFDDEMIKQLHQMILDAAQNTTERDERDIVSKMEKTKSYSKLDALHGQLSDNLNKKVNNIAVQFMNSFFTLKKELKDEYGNQAGKQMTLQQSKELSKELFLVFSDVIETANKERQQPYYKLKDMDLSKLPAELVNKYVFGSQIN